MVKVQLLLVSACVSVAFARSHTVDLVSAAVANAAAKCAKVPTHRVDCYPPSANFPEPTEELCMAQGCCWKSLENGGVPCAFAEEERPSTSKCSNVAKPSRMACRNPRFASPKVLEDGDACASAGCCFEDGDCFQPMTDGYELLTLDETSNGWRGTLALHQGQRGPFGNDVPLLELHVVRESPSQVRIRITDPAFPRYEVPDLPVRRQEEKDEGAVEESNYEVHFTPWPFGVAITRRHSGEVLFNSTPPVEREADGGSFSGLVFENQFIEVSTQLAEMPDGEDPILYGLGERLGSARLRADDGGDLYPMFARAPNASAPVHSRSGGDNLYGVHPFVLQLEDGQSGNAHGVFLLSSNAMEVVARRDALTYRLTGGVIDLFVFSGPTPQDVIKQYTDVVGRPAMPPYWALGYHIGRRGGEKASVEKAMDVVSQLRMAGVPMDAYWQDSEYMADNGRALSLDQSKFSHRAMRAFIDDLHFHSQYFVCVQVPAVSSMNASNGIEDRSEGMARYNAVANAKQSKHALATRGGSEDEDVEHSDHDGRSDDGDREDTGSSEGGKSEHRDHDTRSGSEDESKQGERDERSSHGDREEEGSDNGVWDPMARGEELDVFVKGVNGERYAEKAFRSGWAVFVDFFHPEASRYWHEQLAMFHKYVMPFDGLWLDKNEPSSSCDCALAAEDDMCAHVCSQRHLTVTPNAAGQGIAVQGDGGFIRTNDVNFPFDPYRQPFAPGQNEPDSGGHGNLNSATLPMAALHHSSLHYNLHSLYGHAQARATQHALNAIVKKRSLLLSRSTFSGSGRYAGHWLGDDTKASWEQLRLSISGTLQMNLLGVPLTGPNVCGSGGRSSAELCVRWHQAASFLPLLRNHAESDKGKQTPVDFDADALNILRSTLLTRYRFLPYMYTRFFEAHRSGSPVVRPLSFEFPDDKSARNIEHQYLVGPALMVSPVVHEGAISAEVYFPDAHWYDVESGKLALDPASGDNRRVSLLTPLPKLQIHLRGGYIVPTQQPLTTTALSRRGGFTLLAALDPSQDSPSAVGELYVDDGDSLSAVEDHRYSLMRFGVYQNSSDTVEFKNTVKFYGYAGPEMQADVSEIRVYGVRGGGGFAANSSVDATLVASSGEGSPSGQTIKADYFAQSDMLVLSRLKINIGQDFHVKVVAQPATAPEGEKEGASGKSVDANTSGKSGSEEENASKGGESEKKSEDQKKKKSKFSITGIVGIVVGCAFLAAIILVFLLRRRREGYNIIG